MKKLISLLLVFAIALGLCACNKSEPAGETGNEAAVGLQVGFAREKIHPEQSVPLAGYGGSSNRMSTGFLDYIQTTCIAFTEGDETLLMFTQDLLFSNKSWTADVRNAIETAFGIPGDHIMISATHTHSAPDILESTLPVIQTYYKQLYLEAFVRAAANALDDRASATLLGYKTQTENLNFVRHYKLSDGTYAGDNFGNFYSGASILEHAAPNDPDLLIIKADRKGDKKDIVIMNWQAHPCKTGGSANTVMSADIIGSTRDKVEADTGMHCAYFTGAAGNQNTSSRIQGEEMNMDNKEFGAYLGQIVIDNLANLQPIEGSGIKTSQVQFEQPYNHDDEHLIAEATEVMRIWNGGNKDAANAKAKELGLNSIYHASSITARVKRGASGKMELNAVRVGGLAFVTAPYEMFTENAIYIKENSPYDMTFICTQSNEHYYYIPSKAAFEYSCYESNLSIFARGSGEAVAEQFITMLESLQ